MAVPVTALAFSPDGHQVAASGYHELTLWKIADGTLATGGFGGSPSGSTASATAPTASGWQPPAAIRDSMAWRGSGPRSREAAASQSATWPRARTPSSPSPSAPTARSSPRPAPTGSSGSYETETGKLLVQIEDHADWIFDIAFSPDGKKLATASRDKTSKVFDVEKKESLVTFTGHGQPVYTVAFSPDGKSVTSGGEDNVIRVWTIEGEAKQVREIGGFGGTVFRLRYSPDGKTLAACSADKSVRLFKADERRPGPHAPGPSRLGLRSRNLPRRQDPCFRELGRRGPPLEPGRRQAPADPHRRAGAQARNRTGRAVSPM